MQPMPIALDPTQYRRIPGYSNYAISAHGDVVSYLRVSSNPPPMGGAFRVVCDFPQRELKPKKAKTGYWCVVVYRDDRNHGDKVPVHKLVALAWIGPRPVGMICRHLDGNKDNNHYANIAYGSCQDNMDDKIRHGNLMFGEKHARSKMTEASVVSCRDRYAAGERICDLAREHNVHWSAMNAAIKGRNWRYLNA